MFIMLRNFQKHFFLKTTTKAKQNKTKQKKTPVCLLLTGPLRKVYLLHIKIGELLFFLALL